jgi:hypothetical protein
MKKRHFIFILAIILIIILSSNIIRIKSFKFPETTLRKAFNNSGAKIVSAEIYFWGKLDKEAYNSFDKLEEIAEDFSNELGLNHSNNYSKNIVENDMLHEIQISGTMPESGLGGSRLASVNLQSKINNGDLTDKFISVDVIEDLSSTGMEDTRKRIEKVFRKYKIDKKVTSCITGNFDSKLSYNQMNDICRLVFKEAGAKKVEGITGNNLISVSAYSPAMSHYIKVRNNKINLNLALRYNSYEDKTYLWLATPVITTEY